MDTRDFEMISVEEFARRMDVSRSTIFSWLTKGYLIEGKIFIRVEKTIRFIWSLETVTALALQTTSMSAPEAEVDHVNGSRQSAVNLDF